MDREDVAKPATPTKAAMASSVSGARMHISPTSSPAATQLDREQLADTLDKIHVAASQTAVLTTFNDFAPATTSDLNEDKGAGAGELVQQSLSGLYSRFKEAVGVSKGVQESSVDPRGQASAPDAIDARRVAAALNTPRPSSRGTTSTINSIAGAAPLHEPVVRFTPSQQSDRRSNHAPTSSKSSSVMMVSSLDPSSTTAQPILSALPTAAASVTRSLKNQSSGVSRHAEDRESQLFAPLEAKDSSAASRTSSIYEDTSFHMPNYGDEPVLMPASPHDGLTLKQQKRDVVVAPSIVSEGSQSSSQLVDPRSRGPVRTIRTPDVIDRLSQSRTPVGVKSKSSSIDMTANARSSINPASQGSVHYGSAAASQKTEPVSVPAKRISGSATVQSNGVVVSARLELMRKQVLSKEFWMADETTKECFLCGTSFSAFRRKHHCRTCGCIFDSKCTSIIAGQKFGVSGSLRVCKTCLDIINRRYDSGSDESGDESYLPRLLRPYNNRAARGSRVNLDDSASIREVSEEYEDERTVNTPMMAIPATRRVAGGSHHRKSAILEFEGPQLSRPSSSRSLKSLAAGRPQSSGHRRIHSKSNLLSKFKQHAVPESAPFRQTADDELRQKFKLPAFHDDNIIDPELAPYMSEESSGDEQMSIFATLNSNDVHPSSVDPEKAAFGQYMSSGRRHRARYGEKSISGFSHLGRGADEAMYGASFSMRPPRRRNLSTTSQTPGHMPSPRPKSGVFTRAFGMSTESLHLGGSPSQNPPSFLHRSDSMRRYATKNVEIDKHSLRHNKELFAQLLESADIPNAIAWEAALVPILLRCAGDVDPDTGLGDLMDIRHYVKIKKVPGGKPSDSSYVSGVIFTKNLALKSMPRKMTNPRIVIVTFPLEYQRTQQQHFMSLDPVLEQERNFLRNIVGRLVKLRPTVLLAEKNVSGVALQYLSEAGIAVIYNVKQAVIGAVARCTKADIISSLDMLAIPTQVGTAGRFEVKTYVNDEFVGRKKTCVIISGCDRTLGCTIALRGPDTSTLRRIKRIIEFMAYVCYNSKLESALLRCQQVVKFEGAGEAPSSDVLLDQEIEPEMPSQGTLDTSGASVPLSASEHGTVSSGELHQTDVISPAIATGGQADQNESAQSAAQRLLLLHNNHSLMSQDNLVPEDVPMPTYYSDVIAKYRTRILSASYFVKFDPPYLLMKAREQERRLEHLRRLRDQDRADETADPEKAKPQRFHLIKPEMVHQMGHRAPVQTREVLRAVHDAEYDKALYNYQTQTKQWENYMSGSIDLFDPYSHQNVVVLYSVICTETKVPCSEPGLIAFGFYHDDPVDNVDPDCTIQQYIEDLCENADSVCHANGCDRPMGQHHRTYVHDKARLTVFVDKNVRLPFDPRILDSDEVFEEEDPIYSWSYCKICKRDMAFGSLSETARKYSFGKYLELCFWGQDLRLATHLACPHDYQKEHIKYYRCRDSTMRIHYDPVDLLEIIVPRARITWKVEHDLQLKNETFTRTEERWTRYMTSVRTRLKSIRIDSVLPDKAESCRIAVEELTKRALEEQGKMIRELQKAYMSSKYYEILPLNAVVRQMLERVVAWDSSFAKFEADFLPDKDIRQLTMLQLRKMFTDNDSKESLNSTADSTSINSTEMDEKTMVSTTQTSLSEVVELSETDPIPGGRDSSLNGAETTTEAHTETMDQNSNKVSEVVVSAEPPQPATSSLPVDPPNAANREEPPIPEIDRGVEDADQIRAPASERADPTPELADPPSVELPQYSTDEKGTMAEDDDRGRPTIKEPQVPRHEGDQAPASTAEKSQSPSIARTISHATQSRSQSILGRTITPRDLRGDQGLDSALRRSNTIDKGDKKTGDRFGLAAFKSKKGAQSSIPRFVHGKKKETKVSSLARHFEQLSREFEKERVRDRNKRAARQPQSRTFLPRSSSKAIVEVYDDVEQAVQEPGPSDDDPSSIFNDQSKRTTLENPGVSQSPGILDETPSIPITSTDDQSQSEPPAIQEVTADDASTTLDKPDEKADKEEQSHAGSDDDAGSDADRSFLDDIHPDVQAIADSLDSSEDLAFDLPKHQKTSLMKLLTTFWAERSASGWSPLEYPLNITDHVFVDSDVIVREDEPSSLIAFALSSEDYQAKLAQIRHQWKVSKQRSPKIPDFVEGEKPLSPSDSSDAFGPPEDLEQSLLRSTGTHLKYQFSEGSAKMLCKIFYAEQFDALRRKCGVSYRIVESLSRCMKWDSKGGKTKSVFLKTLDDRLIMKSLSQVETAAFLRFAPAYFSIMAEALFHDLPSVIAKMLGFFQVIIKNSVTNTEIKLDFLIMENLFYDRSPSRIFDLKGSMRNRKIESTGEQNEVLLDENMVEYIYESPLFAREHAKKVLRASVWNDTLFLARQNVMDYSLMVAVDETRKELVVGIIDCIRTYTWDKRLESWIKDRGLAGGGRNRPTVTSPKEYKSRFREAMARYILQAPNSWHHFNAPVTGLGEMQQTRFEDGA